MTRLKVLKCVLWYLHSKSWNAQSQVLADPSEIQAYFLPDLRTRTKFVDTDFPGLPSTWLDQRTLKGPKSKKIRC